MEVFFVSLIDLKNRKEFDMKAQNFIYVCLFVFFLSVLANAQQCPPGWNYVSLPFGPDPSGCTFQVEFCYKCGITGADPSNVKVLNIKPLNGCMAPDKDWLISQIRSNYSIFCTVPACDDRCLTIIIEFPLCFQCHTFWGYYGGTYHYTSWYEACPGSGYCLITDKICKDYQTNQIIKCPGWITTYQTFNLNCQTEHIDCKTQFNPDFEGERITSECFKLYTCP